MINVREEANELAWIWAGRASVVIIGHTHTINVGRVHESHTMTVEGKHKIWDVVYGFFLWASNEMCRTLFFNYERNNLTANDREASTRNSSKWSSPSHTT